jgi:flagellar basal-body rod modification protein FlgD
MEVNTRMSPQELGDAARQTNDVNNRLRRPDGTVRGTGMDKNAFLRLLVTQLRHQDPTQPMQDREFVAQMAQFSSLEQMTSMNNSMQSLQNSFKAGEAYSLLGKRVDALNPANGEVTSGTVSRVSLRENVYRVTVNNREYELSQIQSVYSGEQRPAAQVQSEAARPAVQNQGGGQRPAAPVENGGAQAAPRQQ